jgi:hypothetical protein
MIFLELPESAELMEDIAEDADADTDDAVDDDDSTIIFTIVWLYYITWMININNKRTNEMNEME